MKREQNAILKLLQEELTRARLKNPRYSLRAFSRKLGLPVSALSGIMGGKLPITRKSGEKILQNLSVGPKVRSELLGGLKYRRSSTETASGPLKVGEYRLVDMDQFHLISDWYYFAILSAATTDDFDDSPEWLSKTFGIQKREAKTALTRLERIGLLARDPNGRLTSTGNQFRTTEGIPSVYIRKHHLEGLDLARRSMEEDGISSCDFSSITMAIDPDRLLEAKKMISEFRKTLSAFLEVGSKKEVYRMSVQLFPLSHRSIFSKTKE